MFPACSQKAAQQQQRPPAISPRDSVIHKNSSNFTRNTHTSDLG